MKNLLLISIILLLTSPLFAQEIPFIKQQDKQTHFVVVLTMVAPISYGASIKLTKGDKLKAALLSIGITSAIAGSYEIFHDKALGLGDPSIGDFIAGVAGQVVFTAAATLIVPSEKQKVKRKKKRANRKANRIERKKNKKRR
jgi:hypothetical protein